MPICLLGRRRSEVQASFHELLRHLPKEWQSHVQEGPDAFFELLMESAPPEFQEHFAVTGRIVLQCDHGHQWDSADEKDFTLRLSVNTNDRQSLQQKITEALISVEQDPDIQVMCSGCKMKRPVKRTVISSVSECVMIKLRRVATNILGQSSYRDAPVTLPKV